MRAWLRRCLLVLAVFALCWGGAIWYWRAGTRVPTAGDLAGAMLLLPLSLLLAFWLGKKLLARLAARPAMAAAVAATPQADAAPTAAPPAPLHIVAAALRMPGGATPEELTTAMQARQARPALDPELLDENGYPLLCGKVAGVQEDTQQQTLAAWLRQHPQPGLDAERFPFNPEDVRALALGAEVLADLMYAAMRHPLLPAWLMVPASARAAMALPTLQLHLLLPAAWSPAQSQAGSAWLHRLLLEQGWPPEKLALPTLSATPQPAPFALLAQIAARAAQDGQPVLAIVLACNSYIGEMSVHDWASREQLFSAGHADGQIPGEGAAGLLLANSAEAAQLEAPASVLLHRGAAQARDSAAGPRKQGEPGLLASLTTQALASAAVASADITLVSADTDQRAGRMLELMNCTSALLPELDLGTQVLSVAAACGHAGPVATLAALALAQHAAASGGQVLCLSNLDPLHYGAIVVGPPAGNGDAAG
ncbi:hypothetical protein O0880_23005 [Janthinobacterium sp. SUN118]|uniref:hypothetical protein n=1 Tax=Janthinobacterium sp. SUN118 TaxID=3004100 RepID=UPI0025AFF241|nr:hypothetical protein [Janthinobacterium sp. SUN118]MDN2712302.1 hypothetical protein [Janthinobacterium sp. SUN118]